MITLHQYPPLWDIPSPSPYCIKVETYLKMGRLEYEAGSADLKRAPMGKLPYIVDGDLLVPDSELIIDYLERTYEPGIDDLLEPRDRAIAHALTRMLDENLYWAIVYSRWIEDRNWPITKNAFFGHLPDEIRDDVASRLQGSMLTRLRAHGLGLHDRHEIYNIAVKDLDAIDGLLDIDGCLFGSSPTRADASIFAYLASIWYPPIESPLRDHVGIRPKLASYCSRMKQRFFPL